MKTKNRILAISVAVPATPPKPKTAAIIATIRNINAYLNMAHTRLSYPPFQ